MPPNNENDRLRNAALEQSLQDISNETNILDNNLSQISTIATNNINTLANLIGTANASLGRQIRRGNQLPQQNNLFGSNIYSDPIELTRRLGLVPQPNSSQQQANLNAINRAAGLINPSQDTNALNTSSRLVSDPVRSYTPPESVIQERVNAALGLTNDPVRSYIPSQSTSTTPGGSGIPPTQQPPSTNPNRLAELSGGIENITDFLTQTGNVARNRTPPEVLQGLSNNIIGPLRGLASLVSSIPQQATQFGQQGSDVGNLFGNIATRINSEARNQIQAIQSNPTLVNGISNLLGIAPQAYNQILSDTGRRIESRLEVGEAQLRTIARRQFLPANEIANDVIRETRNVQRNSGIQPTDNRGLREIADRLNLTNDATSPFLNRISSQVASNAPNAISPFRDIVQAVRSSVSSRFNGEIFASNLQNLDNIVRNAQRNPNISENENVFARRLLSQINTARIGDTNTPGTLEFIGNRANAQLEDFVRDNSRIFNTRRATFGIGGVGLGNREVIDPSTTGQIARNLQQNIGNVDTLVRTGLRQATDAQPLNDVSQAVSLLRNSVGGLENELTRLDAARREGGRIEGRLLERPRGASDALSSEQRAVRNAFQNYDRLLPIVNSARAELSSADRNLRVLQDPSSLGIGGRIRAGASGFATTVNEFADFNVRNLQFSLVFGLSQAFI